MLISVEGQTEAAFVRRVLWPHLLSFNVVIIPTIVVTKEVAAGPDEKGGMPSYPRVKRDILALLGDTNAVLVTTMYDYYRLHPTFPGRRQPAGNTARERVRSVELAMAADIPDRRYHPYLSLHEFEALLFSDPSAIAAVSGVHDAAERIADIRAEFDSPEEIDDEPATCPSARLRRLIPRYGKIAMGILIAERAGIATIRVACPHFSEWLQFLESRGTA